MMLAEIVAAIREITDTEFLSIIQGTVRERSKQLRAMDSYKNLSELTIGDTVKLKGLSPKYLNGVHAEVVSLSSGRPGRIKIKLIEPIDARARKRFGTFPVSIPASCVDRV